MTYGELKKWIKKLDERELSLDVTIWDNETQEYFPVKGTARCDDGVLDHMHPILTM